MLKVFDIEEPAGSPDGHVLKAIALVVDDCVERGRRVNNDAKGHDLGSLKSRWGPGMAAIEVRPNVAGSVDDIPPGGRHFRKLRQAGEKIFLALNREADDFFLKFHGEVHFGMVGVTLLVEDRDTTRHDKREGLSTRRDALIALQRSHVYRALISSKREPREVTKKRAAFNI